MLYRLWRQREELQWERGTFFPVSLAEAAVYFLTTMGFPDYLLNTVIFRGCGWVEDRRLPATLVTAAVFPGALIAFMYLRNGELLDLPTLLICAAANAAGSMMGARQMTRMDGNTIRNIMGGAMVASMGALLFKMVVSAGAAGTAAGLSPVQLCIAVPIIFFLGWINMFGVPMKPPAVALFLLLGMSPMSTLTLMLAMGVVSPMAGGIRVLRTGIYQKKIALYALPSATVGALLGSCFTVTLHPAVLNGILLAIMAGTAISMLRPQGRKNS